MKILWVCNVPIPTIAKDLNIEIPNICGWLSGLANSIKDREEIDLHICFPLKNIKSVTKGKIKGISYYAFVETKLFNVLPIENQFQVSRKTEANIREIIELVTPDILHIFGTEYPHSLTAVNAFNNSSKSIINIQGLTSICAIHYNTGIPYCELKKFTLSNFIRGNFIGQANRFKKRGEFEREIIKSIDNVIGRTDWDYACCTAMNPLLNYYFCNESLRDTFYEGHWQYNDCQKYSIFMSQASYPIKGLHFLLRALPEVLKEYPKTHLYIAGNDLTKMDSIYEKLKISSYAKYIRKLIQELNLHSNVTFTGALNEIEMKEHLLKANVFVSASTIENSPNSLGEAMLLGLPCISSDVGGVRNLIEHGREGYTYQADAPYMLSYYIKKIFADQNVSEIIGNEAKLHAKVTHNREINARNLLKIYHNIYKNRI